MTIPLSCQNPKQPDFIGGVGQRKYICFPNQDTVAPGHLETQKRLAHQLQ